MEGEACEIPSPQPRVKAIFHLGLETYSVSTNKGILSEQLVSMKEESMYILKEFITKHNVPNDVPDDELDGTSSEDEKVPVKSKKQRK